MHEDREDHYTQGGSNEKWHSLSLVLGILSYILFFMKSLVWTISFGRFGFTDDWPECVAVDGIE